LPPQYEFSPETEHTFLQRSDYQVVPSEVAESLDSRCVTFRGPRIQLAVVAMILKRCTHIKF